MFVVCGTRRHLCEQRVGGEGSYIHLRVRISFWNNDVHSALGACGELQLFEYCIHLRVVMYRSNIVTF